MRRRTAPGRMSGTVGGPMTRWLGAALLALAPSMPAHADPGYYLVTPYDETGQLKLEARYWTVQNRGGRRVDWPEFGIGYGIHPRWTTLLLPSFIRTQGVTGTTLSSLNWQNDFMLTQGQYDVDLALHTLLVRNHGVGSANAIEFGPSLQYDLGRVRLNGNLIFERSMGEAVHRPTQLKYQWQVNYRWRPQFQFGLQGFGEIGDWNQWPRRDRQSHRLGPVISGTLPLGGSDGLHYQFALLEGRIYGRSGRMLAGRLYYLF